jgi:hypothetical protein
MFVLLCCLFLYLHVMLAGLACVTIVMSWFYFVSGECGWRYSLVVRAECWHAGDPGSNPRQGWPLYIWMYTPSAVSILGMDVCAI